MASIFPELNEETYQCSDRLKQTMHNRDGIFYFRLLLNNKWTWIDIITIGRHYSIRSGSAMISIVTAVTSLHVV